MTAGALRRMILKTDVWDAGRGLAWGYRWEYWVGFHRVARGGAT
jgi:hypothetical protein